MTNIIKSIILISIFTTISFLKTHATPSISGATGLISIPTAESLKYKEFNIAFDHLWGLANSEQDKYFYKLNLGSFQNWEVGVVGGTTPDEGMFLKLKYYLISDDSELPLSIALGSQNISSKSETDIYMIASKKLRSDLGIHFGFKAIFNESKIKPSIMSGINFIINEQIEFLGDINGNGNTYYGNFGIIYHINDYFGARAYIIDITDQIGSQLSLGITYSKFL